MTGKQSDRMLMEKGICDDALEYGLWSWVSDFYSRKMLSSVIVVWLSGMICIAVAVFSAIRFYRSEETRDLIFFATVFVCCIILMSTVKIFAFHLIQRNGFSREIRRLELRLADLTALLQAKHG